MLQTIPKVACDHGWLLNYFSINNLTFKPNIEPIYQIDPYACYHQDKKDKLPSAHVDIDPYSHSLEEKVEKREHYN